MEGSTARAVVIAAVLGGLVGLLFGWQGHHAASGTRADTEIVSAPGYTDPEGEYLYLDTNGDGNSDREAAGLAAAEWWDGQTWHGPLDDREQECLEASLDPQDARRVQAGLVDVPPFGGGSGRTYVIWLRCPGAS